MVASGGKNSLVHQAPILNELDAARRAKALDMRKALVEKDNEVIKAQDFVSTPREGLE
jgi:hypothetical protein